MNLSETDLKTIAQGLTLLAKQLAHYMGEHADSVKLCEELLSRVNAERARAKHFALSYEEGGL